MIEDMNTILGIIASLVAIVVGIGGATKYINNHKSSVGKVPNKKNSSNNTTIIGDGNIINQQVNKVNEQCHHSVNNLKSTTQILFIDDEDFNVTKMLKKAGWKNIKRRGDFSNLDDVDLINANIVFVDIKGVGHVGGYKNEGIGLAAAIKKKYPNKGVVIYSGTHAHDIFNNDLDSVDARLPKNAEPIQFSNLIEQFASNNPNND